MGQEVSNFWESNVTICEIKGLLEDVQLHYIEAALQIKQHFPIDDPILKSLTQKQ